MSPPSLAAALACLLAAATVTTGARAQQEPAGAREPLQLGALERQAQAADPRLSQLELEAARTELTLHNIEADRLPSFSAEGQAQSQSDVVSFPFPAPTGQPLLAPPYNTIDASVRFEAPLVDPTIAPRLAAARAELAEAQARIRTALHGLRSEVDEAFFAAALLQERAGALAAAIADLEARLAEATARVREGTLLAGEAAAVEATLLERRQEEAELRAGRRAALARLSDLTGRPLGEDDVLVLPDLGAAVAEARARLPELRARPEYERFARTRERLERQEAVVAAGERPHLSAYGRAGYGRPGLNFISDQFDAYWLAGLQVRWTPWDWHKVSREREALALERQIVAADEAAFRDQLGRAVEDDLAAVDRLAETLALDERIIDLRQGIERGQRARFDEGVVTAADYVDRTTDLLQARYARAGHRVELAQAGARFLNTLGLEVP